MMMRALGSKLAPRDFGIGGPPHDRRDDTQVRFGELDESEPAAE